MARFEDLTLDELGVLRSALSRHNKHVDGDMRAFLLKQVEGQLDAKRENEKLRSGAENDEAT